MGKTNGKKQAGVAAPAAPNGGGAQGGSSGNAKEKKNDDRGAVDDILKKKTSGNGLTTSISVLVLLLALALGVFYNQRRLTPPSSRPATSETILESAKQKSSPKNLTTYCPSTEMSRGYPNTLQSKLYDGLEPAVLLVLNDDDKENAVTIYWNDEPKAIAPAKSRSRIESFVGHDFRIQTKSRNVSVSMDAPLIVLRANANDGSLTKLQITDESEVPKLKLPTLPESHPTSTGKAIKVRNLSGKRLHHFWVPDDGAPPVYQGVVEPNSESTTASYLTHTFRFTELKDKTKTVYEFSVKPDQEIYAYVDEKTADKDKLRSHLEEVAFAEEYKKKHDGRPWLSYYPHGPVKTFMWPADYIGQEHHVHTEFGPDNKPLNFTLRVVSVRPRAYEVDYLLSSEEARFIIENAREKLAKSSVEMHGENGELVSSDTRTSKNAWLSRGPDGGVLDRVYRRVADLLNVHESTLHHSPPKGCAENMQVVMYKNSAHYAPHHDWGVRGGPHTRLATVLLYLNEPTRGGETTFPLAKVGRPEGLVVKPKKGKAVLFYSQFPDGNVDDESLHEARAVTKGEKWLANVWVHDKVYWRGSD